MNRPGFGACPDETLLMLHSLGFVEDEEAAQVDRHAATCAHCRSQLDELHAEVNSVTAEQSLGHIPAHILARWPRERDALPPTTARAVERHLARCGSCGEDIERLARIRRLAEELSEEADDVDAPEPALEGRLLRIATREPVPAPPVSPPVATTAAPRKSRSQLLLGGYSALATAAAIVFALRGPLSERPAPAPVSQGPEQRPAPGATPAPGTQPTIEPSPGTPTSSPAPAPAVPAANRPETWQVRLLSKDEPMLLSATRGGEDGESPLRPARESDILVVRIEPTFEIADEELVSLELLSAESRRILSKVRAPWKDFHGTARVLLRHDGAKLPPGKYVLRLKPVGPAADGAEQEIPIEYPFEVGAKP